MRNYFTATITRTAVFIVLLSLLPALGIIMVTGSGRYETSVTTVQERGVRFVRIASEQQLSITETTQTILFTLTQLKEIRANDLMSTEALLRNLTSAYQSYDNIFLTNERGVVIASGLEEYTLNNLGDEALLKKARQNRRLIVSNSFTDHTKEKTTLRYILPVFDDQGYFSGMLGADINMHYYEKNIASLGLPQGSTIYIGDENGNRITVYPHPQQGGDLIPGDRDTLKTHILDSVLPQGSLSFSDPEHKEQHVSYQKMYLQGSTGAPYLYVAYIQSADTAYAEAKSLLLRDLLFLSAATLFALLAAWGLSYMAFVKPIRSLLHVAGRLTSGDLGARVPPPRGRGEISLLSREFNTMALALDYRDKELVAAKNMAEFSSKSKSEFLANMSHEIRTPMNAILGMAYLALKTELSPQQHGYVSKLLTAANTLLRIINDILDFSKIEAGKLTMEHISFSLRRLMGNIRAETTEIAGEKGIGIQSKIAPDVPQQLMGDPLRLSQAISTLINEAIEKSERGDVVLTCQLENAVENNAVLRFCIKDAGVGMTPAQIESHRLYFADSQRFSSGGLTSGSLRLAIARQLFRLMGGDVHIESEFGLGTTLIATACFEISGQAESITGIFDGQRALVIEGNEPVRKNIIDTLAGFGLEALGISNAEHVSELLLAAEQELHPFTFLFMEWQGTSAAPPQFLTDIQEKKFLQITPSIIVITEKNRTELPTAEEDYFFDGFLCKPINGSVLFDTLATLIGKQSQDQEYVAFYTTYTVKQTTSLGNTHILLVDDNLINQQVAQEILHDAGCIITTANNGREAVDLLRTDSFHIVLMDLQMPEMDGYTATRMIRNELGLTPFVLPVIAMTAHSGDSEIAACFTAGMNDHTAKPITVDALFACLKRWMPPAAEHARTAKESIHNLFKLLGTNSLHEHPRIDRLMAELRPFIHEGRLQLLHKAIDNNDAVRVEEFLQACMSFVEKTEKPLT